MEIETQENSENTRRIYSGCTEVIAGVNVTASNIWDERARVAFSLPGSEGLSEVWMNIQDFTVFADRQFQLIEYHYEEVVEPRMTGGGRSWVVIDAIDGLDNA